MNSETCTWLVDRLPVQHLILGVSAQHDRSHGLLHRQHGGIGCMSSVNSCKVHCEEGRHTGCLEREIRNS